MSTQSTENLNMNEALLLLRTTEQSLLRNFTLRYAV
jgi:hypothetical protein